MKTNYIIKEKIINKDTSNEKIIEYAIVNGKEHCIESMKNGDKFFKIDNPYVNPNDDSVENLLALSFHGLVGDAIKSIIDGYAHCLYESAFSSTLFPIFFIDETIGNEYRNKSLEGFKNTKVGYSIKFGYKYSFGGFEYLTETGDTVNILNDDKPAIYNTKKEAENVFNSYIEKAKDLFNDISNNITTLNNIIDSNESFPIQIMVAEMLKYGKDKFFTDYSYEIVQNIT